MSTFWIVVTSIAAPTIAVQEFAAAARREGWGMVVAGDTKTPAEWMHNGVDFLSVATQHERFGNYSLKTPVCHYARKNLAYLHAIGAGAKVIIESDDDNRPYPEFGRHLDRLVTGRRLSADRWVNAYSAFASSDGLIWPRGLPLDQIYVRGDLQLQQQQVCPIQQFLANSDPDVDAIYRLLFKEPYNFDRKSSPLFLAPDTFCPFNSQNTAFYDDAFELLYLPAHVSFRMTDIWRSFVAQYILFSQGKSISFHAPTVFQERNAHNLMRDFSDEVVGYLRNDEIVETLRSVSLVGLSTGDALYQCYVALRDIGIVPDQEITLVEQWLTSLEEARA